MNRERLLPIDTDWIDEMTEEIAGYILHNKKKITDMGCYIQAIKILTIVDKHLEKNNCILVKTKP